MSSEIHVTNIVPRRIPARPKDPFSGFQKVENNISGRVVSEKSGSDLKSNTKKMIKKRREMIVVMQSMSFVPMKSRTILLSIYSHVFRLHMVMSVPVFYLFLDM